MGEDGVTSENDASGLNVWIRKLIVCSWWAAEMGVVVLVDEMGVVVWTTDMRVVVWATDVGVVSVTVVASLNWMGGTLVLLLGSDGRDGRCAPGFSGRCARGRRLRVAVGGTVV